MKALLYYKPIHNPNSQFIKYQKHVYIKILPPAGEFADGDFFLQEIRHRLLALRRPSCPSLRVSSTEVETFNYAKTPELSGA